MEPTHFKEILQTFRWQHATCNVRFAMRDTDSYICYISFLCRFSQYLILLSIATFVISLFYVGYPSILSYYLQLHLLYLFLGYSNSRSSCFAESRQQGDNKVIIDACEMLEMLVQSSERLLVVVSQVKSIRLLHDSEDEAIETSVTTTSLSQDFTNLSYFANIYGYSYHYLTVNGLNLVELFRICNNNLFSI